MRFRVFNRFDSEEDDKEENKEKINTEEINKESLQEEKVREDKTTDQNKVLLGRLKKKLIILSIIILLSVIAGFIAGTISNSLEIKKGIQNEEEITGNMSDAEEFVYEELYEATEAEDNEIDISSLVGRVVYASNMSERFEYSCADSAISYIQENQRWFISPNGYLEKVKENALTDITYDTIVSKIEAYADKVVLIENVEVTGIEQITLDDSKNSKVTLFEAKDCDGNIYVVYVDDDITDIEIESKWNFYGIAMGEAIINETESEDIEECVALLCCCYETAKAGLISNILNFGKNIWSKTPFG